MMRNICLICTALLLIGMVACKQRSTNHHLKPVNNTKRTYDITADNQQVTFTSTKINSTEVMHELTLKVDSNTYYHMVTITDLQPGMLANGVPNFNEMER